MILHLALNEAGIKSDIAYVRVKQGGHSPEDHGSCVAKQAGGRMDGGFLQRRFQWSKIPAALVPQRG